MFIRKVIKGQIVVAVLVFGITAAGMPTRGQAFLNGDPLGGVTTVELARPNASGEEIFAELVKQNERRNVALREYSAERTYAVTNLQGKVHAREIVRMEYIAPDTKTFVKTSEEGSKLIRHMVLNRLMDSESSAAAGKDHHDSAITPANYIFTLLGEEQVGAHHCYVVEALPKRKDKYLFAGKVWIDSRDFAVVRIAGHPAKELSFWITRADFVRQYEKVGDFWLPFKDETFVDVKMYGKKIFTIEHRIATVNGANTAAPVAQAPNAVLTSASPKSD
ncbi:MAG: outer membrane lipoprotein-sorting protein [Acidobacteriia bacterium]|nr:outer membrane lipoprotein-sorting protein [Terriglobia bacterium]